MKPYAWLMLCSFFEDHGEVCPANWKPGDDAMVADAAGVAKYLSEH